MTTTKTSWPALSGLLVALAMVATPALAKLPTPSDEAKAKAAEAAAKAAHGGKVENYKLCMTMDRVAAGYHAAAKKAGKAASAPADTPACSDPGTFVYTPPGATPAVAPASAPKPAAVAKK